MIYISSYFSPIGELIIAAKNNYLIGLWLKIKNIIYQLF